MEQALRNEMIRDFIERIYGLDEEKWPELLEDPSRELGLVTLVWETVTYLCDADVASIVNGITWREDRGFVIESTEMLFELSKMTWCRDMRTKIDLLALALLVDDVTQQMGLWTDEDD